MANDIKRIFKQGEIERISKILGDTNFGLTGTEIGHILKSINIEDIDPLNTKWKRLYNALVEVHNKKQSSNHVLSFIAKALEPARFAGQKERYFSIIEQLNTVLAFNGLEFQDDGKFHKINQASSLTEAEQRANRLKSILETRNLHPELYKYCRSELLENNYFHAVLEASKGVADMIRKKTGLQSDGSKLVDSSFGGNNPLLLINSFSNETEKSEQRGFTNLLKGLFSTFRNPTAHALRIEWDMGEQDALDLFSLVSYAFRRIDNAKQNTVNT